MVWSPRSEKLVGKRDGQRLQSWLCCARLLSEVSPVTNTKAHLPHLLVPPYFCASSSPSALPTADTEGNLYLPGNSCDGNTHDSLQNITKTKVSGLTVSVFTAHMVLA